MIVVFSSRGAYETSVAELPYIRHSEIDLKRPPLSLQDHKSVIYGHPRLEAIRAWSVRGELVAQDSRHVLAFAQQPGHIQVVAALEVAPQQRKLRRPPSP